MGSEETPQDRGVRSKCAGSPAKRNRPASFRHFQVGLPLSDR